MSVKKVFRAFWPYAAPRRRWLLVALVLGVIAPSLTTVEIYLFKVVVDDVLIPRNFSLFVVVAGLYVGLTCLESAVDGADRLLSTWLSQRFLVDLRTDLVRHLQTLSLDFFQRSRLGDLLSRVSGDVSAIESFLVSGTSGALSAFLQLVLFVGALCFLHWQLALVSLVVTPLFWLTSRYFSTRLKRISRERQRLSGSSTSVVEQVLSNIALVQAYDQSDRELRRYQTQLELKYRAEMASARLRAMYTPAIDFIELCGVLTVLGIGAWLLTREELTVGGLLAFLTYLSRLYGPVRGLGSLLTTAYTASAGAERVIELFEQQPLVPDRDDAVDLPRGRGVLRFEAVSFSYPHAARPAVDNVSLDVRPGEVIAVVGSSGAGKSTLARLLLRFYAPDSGRLLLDAHDLRDITHASLRRNVAVLLQETLVFDGTVRDNIAYGRPEASDEQIVAAARAADAHDFIVALQDGYHTRVGERGRRLSGGQAQRVAIARAMLRDAPVLLLDEPTTGLDAQSADRVTEPLRRLMAGRATLIISHNLSIVHQATLIVVMDGGRIVERGTHEELLTSCGRYAELWRLSGHDRPQADARVIDTAGPNGSSSAPPPALVARAEGRHRVG